MIVRHCDDRETEHEKYRVIIGMYLRMESR